MRVTPLLRVVCLWMLLLPLPASAQDIIQHALEVSLHPETHRLEVRDTLTLPANHLPMLRFFLHRDLQPTVVTSGVRLMAESTHRPHRDEKVPITRYGLRVPPGVTEVILHYQGKLIFC